MAFGAPHTISGTMASEADVRLRFEIFIFGFWVAHLMSYADATIEARHAKKNERAKRLSSLWFPITIG